MHSALRLITGPTAEILTFDEVKLHLRVDYNDEDAYIEDLQEQARAYVENKGGLALLTQTWEQVWDMFPYWNDPFELYRWPIQSITSLTYVDSTGVAVVWPSSNYVVNTHSIPPRIAPIFAQYWPLLALQSLANVTVRYVAGFTSADLVPARIKRAILLLCGHWYENREDVVVGPRAVSVQIERSIEALIRPMSPPLVA